MGQRGCSKSWIGFFFIGWIEFKIGKYIYIYLFCANFKRWEIIINFIVLLSTKSCLLNVFVLRDWKSKQVYSEFISSKSPTQTKKQSHHMYMHHPAAAVERKGGWKKQTNKRNSHPIVSKRKVMEPKRHLSGGVSFEPSRPNCITFGRRRKWNNSLLTPSPWQPNLSRYWQW